MRDYLSHGLISGLSLAMFTAQNYPFSKTHSFKAVKLRVSLKLYTKLCRGTKCRQAEEQIFQNLQLPLEIKRRPFKFLWVPSFTFLWVQSHLSGTDISRLQIDRAPSNCFNWSFVLPTLMLLIMMVLKYLALMTGNEVEVRFDI